MQVVVSSTRLMNELMKYLDTRIAELSSQIIAGVPVEVYKERVAELRSLTDLRAELPAILKKAKD